MDIFTPKEYLKIDIANSFGLDKLSWQKRIEWFDANEANLSQLIKDAEEPAMFYAGIEAWRAVQQGKPIGYPISLDATSSGIQILSVLTGDRSAALLSNVIDSGKRSDAYTEIYQHLQNKVGDLAKLEREPVKKAVMTSFYGSQQEPRKTFGEGPVLEHFYATLEEKCPYVWELNQFLLDSWDPEATEHRWILPDNFHVQVKVEGTVEETFLFLDEKHTVTRTENIPTEKGRSLCANLTHSVDGFVVREMLRRCYYRPDHIDEVRKLLTFGTGKDQPSEEATTMTLRLWELYQQTGYLSARILDYLNYETIHLVDQTKIQELVDSLPERPFQFISVHDQFRCHPNYGTDLRRQYNLQLSLIARSTLLQSILRTMLVWPDLELRPVDDLSAEALDANYALS